MANRITTLFDFKEQGSGLKKIKSDVQGVDGAWNKAKTGFRSAMTEFQNSRAAQAAALGIVGKIAFESIQAASALEEAVNGVKVAYGEAGDSVLKLGEDSATQFGMSERAFADFAIRISGFATQIAEKDGRAVADVVGELTQRATDFASAIGIDANDAATVFMSTLAGETEPIRRYGKDVSAATVEQLLLNEGIVESKSAITESDKVLGRYLQLMKETDGTAGDFANTSESLANQTKTATANFENLSASLGDVLIPVAADATQAFNDLIAAGEDAGLSMSKAMEVDKFTGGAAAGGRSIGALIKGFDDLGTVVGWFGGGPAKEPSKWARELIPITADLKDRVAEARGALDDETAASIQSSEAMRDQARAANNTADALGPLRRATEDKAKADEAAAEAAEEHAQKVNDLYEAGQRLVGGDIAVRDAQRQAAEAMAELTENATAQSAEVDAATEAQLNAAAAAADYEIKQREANGETLTAKERSDIHRGELVKLAEQLDGPVRDALLGYIAELNNVPKSIDTWVNTNYRDVYHSEVNRDNARAANNAATNPPPAFDRGGVVPGAIGSPQMIKAHGGETILPTHKKGGMTGGPLVHIENAKFETKSDVEAFAQRILMLGV